MATATDTLKNFVDGEFVDAAEGRTSAVINPSTGAEIAQAPDSGAEDVDRAVKAARTAFETWGRTTPGERSLMILKLADAIEERADEIAELESANAGKPLQAFKDDEIPAMVDNLRFFAGAARVPEGRPPGAPASRGGLPPGPRSSSYSLRCIISPATTKGACCACWSTRS